LIDLEQNVWVVAIFILLAQDSSKQLTPTAYSERDSSSAVGNEQDKFKENDNNDNCLNSRDLDRESDRPATVGTKVNEMGRSGIEPPTHGFSVRMQDL
jgi:hypothetical protein